MTVLRFKLSPHEADSILDGLCEDTGLTREWWTSVAQRFLELYDPAYYGEGEPWSPPSNDSRSRQSEPIQEHMSTMPVPAPAETALDRVREIAQIIQETGDETSRGYALGIIEVIDDHKALPE